MMKQSYNKPELDILVIRTQSSLLETMSFSTSVEEVDNQGDLPLQ